jgi:hypothetical protein
VDSSRRATANGGSPASGSDGAVGVVAATGFTVLAAVVVRAAVSSGAAADVVAAESAIGLADTDVIGVGMAAAVPVVEESALTDAWWVIRWGPDLTVAFVVFDRSCAEFDDVAPDTDPLGLESADDVGLGAAAATPCPTATAAPRPAATAPVRSHRTERGTPARRWRPRDLLTDFFAPDRCLVADIAHLVHCRVARWRHLEYLLSF